MRERDFSRIQVQMIGGTTFNGQNCGNAAFATSKGHYGSRVFVTFASSILALSIAGAAGAEPRGRIVSSHIESASKIEVSGDCLFTPGQGGSFALENTDRGKPLFGEILVLTVSIEPSGIAEVRGLTRRGNNSRWGAAQRSSSDLACWQGSDFKICAR